LSERRERHRRERLLPGEVLREDVRRLARSLGEDAETLVGLADRAHWPGEHAWFEERLELLLVLRTEFESLSDRLRLSSQPDVFDPTEKRPRSPWVRQSSELLVGQQDRP
jgi:hypothetical protein